MARSGTEGQAGSPREVAAFAELYREHLATITRYLARRLGVDAAEDAAAEVFIRAYRKHGEYQPQHVSPLPWLYGIAVNVIAEARAQERRRLKTMERLAGERQPAQDASPGGRALDPAIVRALRGLTRIDRETLLLVAWGELSYEETATALDVPIGTVRSRLARARKQIDTGPRDARDLSHARTLQGEHHA